MNSRWSITLLALVLLAGVWHGAAIGAVPPIAAGGPAGTTQARLLPTVTPTTICPAATPELFRVEPVDSPTHLLSQVITVTLSRGEWISITAESGTFTTTWAGYTTPVTITLLGNAVHHLHVAGKVPETSRGGCTYGGYTMTTEYDRLGQPLVIVQVGPVFYYLPVVRKGQ